MDFKGAFRKISFSSGVLADTGCVLGQSIS